MNRQVSMQFGKPSAANQSVSGYATEILTPTVTKTSGNTSITMATAARFGNIIQLTIYFKFTGAVNAGSNAMVATVSGIPLPAVQANNGAGFFSNSGLMGELTTDGELRIRIIGGNRSSSSSDAIITFTYICE